MTHKPLTDENGCSIVVAVGNVAGKNFGGNMLDREFLKEQLEEGSVFTVGGTEFRLDDQGDRHITLSYWSSDRLGWVIILGTDFHDWDDLVREEIGYYVGGEA